MRHESWDELQALVKNVNTNSLDVNTHETIICLFADDTVVYFAEPLS